MKSSKKSEIIKRNKQERHWEDAASYYENSANLPMLASGKPLSSAEARKLFTKMRRRAVSVRIPEMDIDALKRIAALRDSKYQTLIIRAVEEFIDKEEKKILSRAS